MLDKAKILIALAVIAAGVVGFYQFPDISILIRYGMVVGGVIAGLLIVLTSGPGQAAWKFITGSRTEIRKVVWPTRKETAQTTMIVIVMVILIGLLIWLVDSLLVKVIYDMVLGV